MNYITLRIYFDFSILTHCLVNHQEGVLVIKNMAEAVCMGHYWYSCFVYFIAQQYSKLCKHCTSYCRQVHPSVHVCVTCCFCVKTTQVRIVGSSPMLIIS